jgi:type II secretory pathway component GspD/PulD (secretin)
MDVRTLWSVGLLWTLLMIGLSTTLGHMAHLATAEASPPTPGAPQTAQRPAPEGKRPDGSRPVSGDRAHEGTIHLNFRDVDILQMITLMSELTGKNFLVDDKVRGKVTLIAPQPVTRAEAYNIFLTALAMQGFTVVSRGPISTIMPSQDAKTAPLPTVTDPARRHQ